MHYNENNPRCDVHTLQKKLIEKNYRYDYNLRGGLVCFHPCVLHLIKHMNQ